jgi:hypothetical protein
VKAHNRIHSRDNFCLFCGQIRLCRFPSVLFSGNRSVFFLVTIFLILAAMTLIVPQCIRSIAAKASESLKALHVCDLCILRLLGINATKDTNWVYASSDPLSSLLFPVPDSASPSSSTTTNNHTIPVSPSDPSITSILNETSTEYTPKEPTTTNPTKICPACLGILSPTFISSLTTQATTRYSMESFTGSITSLKLNIRIPPQLAYRTRFLQLHLYRELGGSCYTPSGYKPKVWSRDSKEEYVPKTFLVEEESSPATGSTAPEGHGERLFVFDVTDPKDVLKSLLHSRISTATGLKLSSDSPLALEITLDHQETFDEPLRVLSRLRHTDFTYRKKRKRVKTESGFKNEVNYEGVSWQSISKASSLVGLGDGLDALEDVGCLPDVRVGYAHASVYVAGRYMKYERGISNSSWAHSETSIEGRSCSTYSSLPSLSFRCHVEFNGMCRNPRTDSRILHQIPSRVSQVCLSGPRRR